MIYRANLTFAMLSLAASFPCFAKESSASTTTSFNTTIGAEVWLADTKVNQVRRDSHTTGTFYVAIEHDVKYVPNARLRYSHVDADYMGFTKLDLTLYYQILEHDLLHFDVGVALSNLSDTKYLGDSGSAESFDDFIWAWYGYGEIRVPNTPLDVIGEINFGDSNGMKSTDLIAGVQYQIPLQASRLIFRGGYRVIDLESQVFLSSLGKEFIFADGFFVTAEYSF